MSVTEHDRWVAECLTRADTLATAAERYGTQHDYLGATWRTGGKELRVALRKYREARKG